jgi:perosamine synthetase|tara:strand:+ start:221 stop:1399 length:1179 start_codon:yes stop_codon:yes gene_type:complete
MKYKKISNEIIKSVKFFIKKKYVPLHEPCFKKEDFDSMNRCLKSSYVSTVSKFTNIFEEKIKKLTKSKYSIAIVNGTSAIQLAILSCGIKKNDEILIPSLNYIGSTNATIYCNAIPHFVDVENETFGIDTIKLENYLKKTCVVKKNTTINKITKRNIKAIIPTHVFGNPAKINEIKRIAKKFKLRLIEDASECVGSYYKNKHLGTFGDVGVLSFNGNKIITTGGGGAIITDNKRIYKKALNLSMISRKKNSGWSYDYNKVGYNYRLPGINSSLGISQLNNLTHLLKVKRKVFLEYKRIFKDNIYFRLVDVLKNTKSNHWLNTIFIFNSNLKFRDQIITETNKKGIGIRPVWKLMHKIKYLSKYPKMNLQNSEKLEVSLINLPSSPNLYEKNL